MPQPYLDLDVAQMAHLYTVEQRSLREIGAMFDVSYITVWRRLAKAGIDMRDRATALRVHHNHRPA